ncbi:hypothetical protein CHS0354_024772 [Potamilus streckersoni]|uniref:BTB domain-containing protein n=1 Tax=Potamilus streckersoni TaxID=2493646 RepID=A0AAE0RX03_9BIVA|nr:hypothetical protein CHS0354_024772 [Potamilus streckersoni]
MATADIDWQAQRDILSSNRYMFENHVACDVTFIIGKQRQEMTVHKYVMISRSSVFHAMLCGPLLETGPISIPDIEPEVFEQLLRFIYYEAFEPNGDSIFALLYAAKKYAVMCLVDRCLKWLEEGLSPDNVCIILEQARAFDERDLRDKCLEFMMDNGSSVFKHPSFRNLSFDCVEMVLKQDHIEISEEEVYEAMKDWAKNECTRKNIEPRDENMMQVLGGLKHLIRFSGMNTRYFADKVAADEILTLEEKLNFFRGFLGSSKPNITSLKHTKRKLRFREMERVMRFSSEGSDWLRCSGLDAMEFKSSKGVLLLGIAILGGWWENTYQCLRRRSFDVDIEIKLMDESKRSIMSKTLRTNLSVDQSKEILFDERIVLHCSWYSITLHSSTPGGTKDNKGQKIVGLADGQFIEFKTSSLSINSTSDVRCAISGLLICRRL